MKKKTALLALFILPAFFLFHSYNQLFGFVPAKIVLFYAVVIYAVLIAAYLIMVRLKIPAQKATLILFSLAIFILFFAPLRESYLVITFNTVARSYWIMLPLCSLLLVLLARKIIRTENISPKVFDFINIAMLCIFFTEIFTSLSKFSDYKKTNNLIYPETPLTEKFVSPNIPDSSKPDIYFLLFDEYTNNKALKQTWNYDNSSITDWLATNNFYVPSDTRCNYNYTVFSVSSAFNMNYIGGNLADDGSNDFNLFKANKSLSHNETFNILKKENYSIRFLAPFGNDIENNGLEYFFDYMLKDLIPNQTLPGSIGNSINGNLKAKDSLGYDKYMKDKYKSIRYTADAIKKTTDSSSNRKPHFIYGHFLITHQPHLLDSTGKFMTLREFQNSTAFNTYTSQIGYANSVMRELVDDIKTHNKPNTIIIILGDHGFRHFPDSLKYKSLPNFSAIYFPDKNYSKLYNTITPVNIFRVVFDQYFGQTFPLLKDTSRLVKND